MTIYNTNKLILLIIFILNLTACLDYGSNESAQYKLAPINQPSAKLTNKNSNSNDTTPSKGLLLPDTDILTTEENGLVFDLYYTSSDNHDSYQSLGEGWRHTYAKHIDPERPDDASIQSTTYKTLEAACLQGWQEIKNDYYQGLLSASRAEYNENNKLCTIKNDKGIIQTNLIIWDKNNQQKSKVKRLTLPDGNTLLFTLTEKNTNLWTPLNGTVAQLTQIENGWKYQDENDVFEYYNDDGYLTHIDTFGNITQISYNQQQQAIKITNEATNQSISLDYANDNRLWSIKNNLNDKTLNIYFDEKNKLDTLELEGNIEKNYQYNNNGALSKRYITTAQNNVTTHFKYDTKGRLINQKTTSDQVNQKASIKSTVAKTPQQDQQIDEQEIQTIANEANFVYQDNKIIASDQDGNEAKFTVGLINGKEIITEKEVDGVLQKFEFNEDGNLTQVVSVQTQTNNKSTVASASASKNTYQVNLNYNPNKQLSKVQVAYSQIGQNTKKQAQANKATTTFTAEYLYQNKRFNRPTMKKIQDDLEIVEFNNKGQVEKTIHAKLNKNSSNKATALSASMPNQIDYQVINSITYNYNPKGQIQETQRNNQTTQYSYKGNGKLDTILLPSGHLVKKQPFKTSSLQQHDDDDDVKTKATAQGLSQSQKNNLPKIGNSDVKTLFVGGARDTVVRGYFDLYNDSLNTQYSTHKSFSIRQGLSIFNNISDGKKTILIGHSWGADEILDYGDFQPVDLAITIDPVGFVGSWGFRVNTHINVTADPGPMWSISWHRFRICRCCCWGCCSAYGWYPRFSSNWNSSDWIAFAGFKYFNYFWYANWAADDGFTYYGHHNEFIKMLRKVGNSYPNLGIK